MIPGARVLIEEVVARSTGSDSHLHGERHWRAVAATGLFLLEEGTAADRELVLLFALFHDSRRYHDGFDPNHGYRAAMLAHKLRDGFYSLSDKQMAMLELALIEHDQGHTSDDPTVGACWDSDRLSLWRCGRKPNARYLSTEAARERIEWARDAHLGRHSWMAIVEAYGFPWTREEVVVGA